MSLRCRFHLRIKYLKSKIIKISAQIAFINFENLRLKKISLKKRLKRIKEKNRFF